MEIKIVQANSTDHKDLTEIALASKRYWGYPEEWIFAWKEQLQITAEMIENSLVYKAVSDGKTAGFYVLTGNSEKLELEHLWIKPENIGQGTGKILFEHALIQAARSGASRVEIESDPNALGFYKRMGAYQVGTHAYGLERELPVLWVDIKHAGL